MLCTMCEGMMDLDNLIVEEGFAHYESYTDLCTSAARGCQLCQCIREEQLRDIRTVPDNFDENLPISDTQIRCFAFDRKENVPGFRRLRIGQHTLMRKHYAGDTQHDKYLWVFFGVCVGHDDPLETLVRGKLIDQDSASKSSFAILASWVHTCLTTHAKCSQQRNNILPTRVIDVGDSDGSQRPYVLVSENQRGAWLTLSHCWGAASPLTTTSETLIQRQNGLEFDDLPATYKDAITITRRLGFRYLWIDSLCILQDSIDDWRAESTGMRGIYRNAILNISADAATNADDGIFASANSCRHIKKSIISLPCYSSKLSLRGVLSLLREYPSTRTPLQNRAWVLQESVFSPRRIRFSSDELEWLCETSILCYETDPEMERVVGTITDPHSIFQISPEHEFERLKELYAVPDSIQWWYEQLRDYLGRQITFVSDRLPAISGLAQEVAERTGYHYKAGLWEEDFLAGLLWAAPGVGNHSSNAPSWSWASVDCHQSVPTHRRDGLSSASFIEDEEAVYAQVLNIRIETPSGDFYGHVTSGKVTIKGPWRAAAWKDVPIPFFETVWKRRNVLTRHQAINLWPERCTEPRQVVCALDEVLDGDYLKDLEDRAIIFLQIAGFGSWGERRWGSVRGRYALILEPTGTDDEYRRIGMAQIPQDDGMADGWPIRTFTIV